MAKVVLGLFLFFLIIRLCCVLSHTSSAENSIGEILNGKVVVWGNFNKAHCQSIQGEELENLCLFFFSCKWPVRNWSYK